MTNLRFNDGTAVPQSYLDRVTPLFEAYLDGVEQFGEDEVEAQIALHRRLEQEIAAFRNLKPFQVDCIRNLVASLTEDERVLKCHSFFVDGDGFVGVIMAYHAFQEVPQYEVRWGLAVDGQLITMMIDADTKIQRLPSLDQMKLD